MTTKSSSSLRRASQVGNDPALPILEDDRDSSAKKSFDHKSFLKSTPAKPGVYQMYDSEGKILYVGKAKNLKSRVSSYFRASGLTTKTMALVSRISEIQVTITKTETEALLLEQNLIKQQRPPYNILLRDDKSYPYLLITTADEYPRIASHRGSRKGKHRYFGPFPNSNAVRTSVHFLQKVFRIRPCEDSVFKNRSRPCLQYQINRCSGPCVDLISPEEYAKDVKHAEMFLTGKDQQLIAELADEMEGCSAALDFEKAALLRDQIQALKTIQSEQVIEGKNGDVDIIALSQTNGESCVHILYVRRGRVLGSRSYFPKGDNLAENPEELLGYFLAQFYLANTQRDFPSRVVVNHQPTDADTIAEAIAQQAGRKLQITNGVRGQAADWLELATTTAEQNLKSRLASKQNFKNRFTSLKEALRLPETPQQLECYDISHSSGELTVGSCVVFDHNGPKSSSYRTFNIDGIKAGDDYAAMEQVLTRRYSRLIKGEGEWPDIALIDGGKGQVEKARQVMADLGITRVAIIGVAKGTTRKAGFETLIIGETGEEITLDSDNPGLHLIQHIRDESHRFAISGHKQRRDKKRRTSTLEEIPGIGAKRRRELLRHFGGLQMIKQATVKDLEAVPGISRALAEVIYEAFNSP